jgi:hypothetical protein
VQDFNDLPNGSLVLKVSRAHTELERKVERIHRLLEVEGSIVTWNDRIPDPDAPDQMRQIDVSIRRDDCLTLVECRLHSRPQDVQWIEELMGRRVSLGADAVIAVSASGFTKTAQKKAASFGIHLRDFATLSSEEIQNWGRRRTLRVAFCEFTQVVVTLFMKEPPDGALPKVTDGNGNPISPSLWYMLFQQIMHLLDEQKWTGASATVNIDVGAELLVNGKHPKSIKLATKVRRVIEMVTLASVVEYVDPLTVASHAEMGTFKLGASEFIESGDDVAMTVDLSAIKLPENCCFETIAVDAGRVVNMRPNIIGGEHVFKTQIPIQMRYEFSAQ